MTFKEATDVLVEHGVPMRELAGALGVAHGSVIAARLDPDKPGHRKPPAGWREAVLRIAGDRAGAFRALVEALEADRQE